MVSHVRRAGIQEQVLLLYCTSTLMHGVIILICLGAITLIDQ